MYIRPFLAIALNFSSQCIRSCVKPAVILWLASSFSVHANSEQASTTPITSIPTVTYQFIEPNSAQDKKAMQLIKQSNAIKMVSDISRQHVQFLPQLTIVFGAKDGPLYDPEIHQIQIPYQYINNAMMHFTQNHYAETGVDEVQATLDTLAHTLLHELGHAFIADRDIPILGKEEDAVDNFATVILLNYVDNGADIAISSADLFAFEDQDIETFDDLDFIDEHSLDIQRYFHMLCLIYGSDPDEYKSLLLEIDDGSRQEREDTCIYEYESISRNWLRYLNKPRH
jgi:hypothetical protein